MADEPARGPEETEFETGGGPVKPFLDHLEDLRWTFIRCAVSVILGMTICMVAADRVIALLTQPLMRVQATTRGTNEVVSVYLGTNLLGKVSGGEKLGGFGMVSLSATNEMARKSLRLLPIQVGTNWVAGFQWFEDDRNLSPASSVALKNYGPMGSLMVAFQVAFYGGLVLAIPFVLFFIGQYVLPALHLHEKKLLYQVVGIGTFLFLLGVAFCYLVLLRITLGASVTFATWMGFGADEWRAEEYLSFVCKFLLIMGVSFELPVVILVLVRIGLLDYQKLSAFRSYWIVINLVLCAVMTPSGDPITMFIMAAPLHFLYEMSVLVAYIWHRRDLKAQSKENED